MTKETELFAIVVIWIDRKKGEGDAAIDVRLVPGGRGKDPETIAKMSAAQVSAKMYRDKPERHSFVKKLDKKHLLQMLIEDNRGEQK